MANDPLIEVAERSSGAGAWLAVISVVLSMAALLGTGVTEAFFAPEKPRLVGDEKDAMEKAAADAKFRDGSLARSIETDFRLRGRVRRYVSPFWAALMFKLRDVPTRSVIIGDDGFLFSRLRVELDYPHKDTGPSVLAALCGSVARSLATRGSELVVVPLPRKSVAARAYLPSGVEVNPEFDRRVVQTMRDRGVNVVDLATLWEELGSTKSEDPLYIPHETHWSRAGVQSFADELMRQIPGLPRNTTEIETMEAWEKATLANLSDVGIRLRHPAYQWVSPRNEKALLLKPMGREGAMTKGKERADVLLAGSSFSDGFFAQAVLAATLQAPVASSSLKGRLPLVPLHKGLARLDPADLPAFVIAEFPNHQAAAIGPTSDAPVRACFSIANQLGGADRATPLAAEDFPSRRDLDPTKVNKAVVYFPGDALLSSGDGAMSLRLRVKSDEETRWRVSSSGMNLRIKIPAGEHVRMVPFVEGLAINSGFRLIPTNAAALAAHFTLEVTTDANLAAATPLEGTADAKGTWSYAGSWALKPHDSLILRWEEKLKADLRVQAIGTYADGSPFERKWEFKKKGGTRIAIFSLGVARGVTLERVVIGSGSPTMTCQLAPLSLAE